MKQLTTQKAVNYFGNHLIVPDDKGWLAADIHGRVFWIDDEPISNPFGWTCNGIAVFICRVDLEGMDWKDTLMEVK